MYIHSGSTLLHWACEEGHMDLAVMLIENYGANPTSEDMVRVRSDDG